MHLYKIVSCEHWLASQGNNILVLSKEDDCFIHFSTDEQLQKIIEKYWSHIDEFVILKIDANQLKGNLVFETNPGGSTRYYHLYDGSIPLDAVIESNLKSELNSSDFR